ncbi:MAG: hypothetical protein V1749_09270 [Candidatus Desantisbacteria bacterium]
MEERIKGKPNTVRHDLGIILACIVKQNIATLDFYNLAQKSNFLSAISQNRTKAKYFGYK